MTASFGAFSISDIGVPAGFPANKCIPVSVLRTVFSLNYTGFSSNFWRFSIRIVRVSDGVGFLSASRVGTTTGAGPSTLTMNVDRSLSTNLTDGTVYKVEATGDVYSNIDGTGTPIAHIVQDIYTFTFYAYSAPTIPAFLVNRCLADGTNDDEGNRVEATVSFSATAIGGGNVITLKIYRKLVADSTWTLDEELTTSGYSGTVGPEVTTLTYATDTRYDIKAELSDLLNTVSNTKSVLASWVAGEVDSVNHRESFMGRLDERSPVDGDDFHGTVLFRSGLATSTTDAERALFVKTLGLIVASAIASPRGSMTGGTYYLMKWTQLTNSDTDNLVPFAITGDSGIIRGWKVKRAGWYRFSHTIRWNSGSTAAICAASTAVVPAANQASIADTLTEANIDALSTYPFRVHSPAVTAALTQSNVTDCVYMDVDDVIVVYGSIGATKTQDTTASFGRFSIERVG